jgi:hypothetical protein
MTELTLIPEKLRIERYIRIVAVNVVKPYSMVDNLPGTFATDLTHTSVDQYPKANKCLTSSQPRH